MSGRHAARPLRVDAPSALPTRKVTYGMLAGAVVTIAVYVADQFGYQLPAEVATAVQTVLAFAASYLVRDTL